VSYTSKLIKYTRYFLSFSWGNKAKKNIFIFSHKRGRTTLLSHILASHTQICGYRELHCKYNNQLDILRTRATLYEDSQAFADADYLLDKILHNEWFFNEKLFNKENNFYLFILRSPEATMLSMIKRHIQNNSIDTVGMQSTYYIERLKELRVYWKSLKGLKLAIDSDDMLYDTDNTLIKITKFLKLTNILKPEYNTFKNTGVAGAGDMSDNISSGKLNQKKVIMKEEDIALLTHVDMVEINKEFGLTYKLLFPYSL